MKLFVKLVLFLLTFIAIAQANTPPLTSSYELSLSDYGARYYQYSGIGVSDAKGTKGMVVR